MTAGRGLATLLIALLVAGSAPRPAGAQPYPEDEPWQLTPEQLRDAGWEFEDQASTSGNPIGGALALTVGTVVHGIGHLYSGDQRTGRQLLIIESVGLGALGAGILLNVLTDAEGDLAVLYRTLGFLGGSFFVATWLMDVIGTFKGAGTPLPPHSGSLADMRISAGYSHLFQPGIALANVAQLKVRADLGAFFLHPEADYGFEDGYLRFGLDAGVRFGLGRRVMSFLDLTVGFDEVIFNEAGFAYEAIMASLGLSLDLGDAFAHLDGIVYTNRVGFGAQLFRFDFDDSRPLNGDSVISMLVLETGLSANVSRDLLVELGYVLRPDTLVGNVSPTVGHFFATLSYAIADHVDFFVDSRLGRGAQVFTGASFHFWPWASASQ